MKTAFRFLGIGFLLSALLLLGLKYSNVLTDNNYSFSIPFLTKNPTVETTTVQNSEIKVSDTITTTVSTQQTETTKQETMTQETTTESTDVVKITIEANDHSDTIVKKLVSENVITDGSGFYNYIVSNKLDRILQNGTFTVKKGMSFEELGKILTTYPGN